MFAALTVRLPNWLGDTVMAVPALAALRDACPTARVLVAGPWASILTGQGLADVLVDYPRHWGGRLRTADAVRRFGAPIAVLLPNSVEAALSARYWGARRIVGFADGGRGWLLTEALRLPSPRRHQIDEYLMLVESLEVVAPGRVPRLHAPPEDAPERGRARALLASSGAPSSSAALRVGVHLGAAGGPAKVWPADRVAALCRELTTRDAVALLLGTRDDLPMAGIVLGAAPAFSLVGRDEAALLPALLTEIDVLVSGDTGVAHLAAAFGTPVVTLFGPTDPELTAPRGHAAVLRHPVPCAPCFYRACPIDHGCLRGIEPRAVAERALMLARARAAVRS